MQNVLTALCLVGGVMFAAPDSVCAQKKAIPLKIKGDTVLLVKSVPFEVEAPEGAGDYTWFTPAGVEGTNTEYENILRVTKAPAGEFVVRVKMTTIDFEKKKVVKEYAEVTVTLGQGPKPPPDPVKPDGALGLIKASREGMSLVTSLGRTEQAKKLAQAQRTHAAKVAAGVYPDAAKILDGWRTLNKESLSDAEQKVWSPWAASVQLRVSELHKGGKLPGNKEWADAFNEIADGLETSMKAEK